MRTQKTWRLRSLLILLATTVLLPVALVGGWAIKSVLEQRRQEIERSALEISRALATAVNADLESTISSLRTLSYSSSLANGDIQGFYSVARDALPSQRHWRSIVLSDTSGAMLFTTTLPYGSANARMVDPASLPRNIYSRAPVVGSVLTGPMGNMAYPVRIPVAVSGRLGYVLSAAVKPDRILDMVKQQKAPSDWVIAVFDSSGKRVARTRNHRSILASPSLLRLLEDGRPEGIGLTTTLEGVESLTAYTRIANYGWVVAIGIPSSKIEASLLHSVLVYAAGILLSILVYLVLAGYLARSIVSGVNDLRDQAIRLISGATGLKLRRSRISEIEEMREALDKLAIERAQIEASRKELLASLNGALDSTRHALSKAEDAAKAKDIFLAMLGHELRNPLAPIVAALDLMDFKGEDATSHEREIMRRQVDHMRRLVDDLLDASRIIQGKLNIEKSPADIGVVVRHALDSVQEMAKKAGTAIHFALPEKEIWVLGDSSRLIQVITNLLTNALKFAPAGNIHLSIDEQGDQVSITVADDGMGIAPDMLGSIFQAFFQAPQSIARTEGGLGLGLAIVRSIVESHGGAVRAWSEGAGKGSRFEVSLPTIEKSLTANLPSTIPNHAQPRRILVVDDNVEAAELIAAGLSYAGHQVKTAANAREALDLFEDFQPEVAVLDIGLPDIDGYRLAESIRRRYPDWAGQLIALTGYGQAADKEKAAAAGFDVHLTKPVSIAELSQAILAMQVRAS
ncbi:MAG: ATP-binding protein [Burkholderiaceae bacterium]